MIIDGYRIRVGGDLIIGVDGRAVDGSKFLGRARRRRRPGDTAELTIYRNGRTLKLRVRLAEGSATRL